MGSCVSVHKDPESAMKLRLVFGSKNDRLVIPSPVKDKPLENGDTNNKVTPLQLKSQLSPAVPVTSFRDFGSKEETFFDSQAWLESDCEDDFLSVNGDFTPSRGNTPVHLSALAGNLPGNRASFGERPSASLPQSTPTDKKKRLSDLFKESLRNELGVNDQDDEDDQNGTSAKKEAELTGLPLKSNSGTPYAPASNGQRTPNAEFTSQVKTSRSAQCCLPRMLSSRSFNGRRKSMSPENSVR